MSLRPRIAVIGAGVAGIGASYLLQKNYDVWLLEKESRLGGHTNTVQVSEPDQELAVDTGFIVFNERNYPNFVRFLEELGVESQESNMSFSYHSVPRDFFYAGINLDSLFAQRKNVFRKEIWRVLQEIPRFYSIGTEALRAPEDFDFTLGDLLRLHRFNTEFQELYLLPMSAAIWSTPAAEVLDYPAVSFLRFWKNHGLLSLLDRPQWRTVRGGSQQYIKKFLTKFHGRVEVSAQVQGIQRHPSYVSLSLNGESLQFDKVVFATHADQVLPLLADPTTDEKEAFRSWMYQKNATTLHTDSRVLPPHPRAWASWNYREFERSRLAVTYYMNRLQSLDSKRSYCVSLNWPETDNAAEGLDRSKVLKEIHYEHPTYTKESLRSQKKIAELSGQNRTYFCGSYLGHGFHEDALRSSVVMARQLGLGWS